MTQDSPPLQGPLQISTQEVAIMNFPISEHSSHGKFSDALRSAEFFIGMLVIISLLGLVFLAAV
jgi:hypothetical protein